MLLLGFLLTFLVFPPMAGAETDSAAGLADSLGASQRIHRFSRQTVDRVRYLGKRKQFTWRGTPYGFTGLPLVFFNLNRSWNFGGRIHLTNYSRYPYRYQFTLQWNRPPLGMAGYFIRFRVPRLLDTGWGLDLQTGFSFGFGRYYGRGNDSANIQAFTQPQNPAFRDRYYYHYVLERPRFVFSLSRQIIDPLAIAVSFGSKWSQLSPRGNESFLFTEQPSAGRRRTIGTVGGRLVWDTRDDEVSPRRGVMHEWSYETSRGALLGLYFDEVDLERFTFTDVRFFGLSRRLVLGNRFVFEVLRGSEKSVDELGEIGPIRSRFKGLGGISSLRGFDTQRFVDDVRFIGNTELRCRIGAKQWLGQYLEWHGIAFVDVGRVWPSLDRIGVKGVHASGGAGLWLVWDANFVIRLESGFSSERFFWGLFLRNSF